MKKLLILFLILAFCAVHADDAPDYADPSGWILCETEKEDAAYDLFYVYPTLSARTDRLYLDRTDEKTMRKVREFVRAQTGIFASDARIFAPFIRQMEYPALIAFMKDADIRKQFGTFSGIPHFARTVEDVGRAFRHYRENFRKGRPFLFVGHSQGAMELYELLRQDREIALSGGFVAAYLPGLPGVSAEQIRADFRDRGIAPAQNADDIGVIAVWNTQNAEAESRMFTGNGAYCINPLNWHVDPAPAAAAENKGAFFYDYRDGTTRSVPAFCGARVDPVRGALIVDLPSLGKWDAKGFMGKGIFHMNDIWFFAENLKSNAKKRVENFRSSVSVGRKGAE